MADEVNMKTAAGDGGSGATDPRLYLRDEELDRGVGLILMGERALSRAAASQALDADLSPPELEVLLAIRHWPGRSVSDIRERLGATVPTFARILGRLDKRGLISKAPQGTDRRRRHLTLSGTGEAALAPVGEAMRAALRRAYRDAGPEAVAGARAVLEALAND